MKKQGIYTLPALTAGIKNQGLTCYVPRKDATILKNVITISSNGENSGSTFFQSEEFTVLQDAYAIKLKKNFNFKLTNFQYLYLTSIINFKLKSFNWGNKAGWLKIKDIIITLPIKNDKIDFEIMEKIMKTLRKQHVKQIQSYIKYNSFDNTNLSKKEKNVIKNFGITTFQHYRLEDLFEISGTVGFDRPEVNFVEQGINFIGRTSEYNGKQGEVFISKEVIVSKNKSGKSKRIPLNESNTITASVIGNYKYVRFQKKEYYCSQNINKLTPRGVLTDYWCEDIAYFFIPYIQKFVSLYNGKRDGYLQEDMKNHVIKIPIKNNNIDFEYMKTVVSATRKILIKSLIEKMKL